MSDQLTFNFHTQPPIKGFPMLHWTGKRPFEYTSYFPAQCRERHGEESLYVDKRDDKEKSWYNRLYWGDNLQVMSHLMRDFQGQVDLIYIDPPFDSRADYKKAISLKGKQINNEYNGFEEKQYSDIWSNDEYLQFMYERLILIKELLSETGSVFLHCDWNRGHALKLICDEVFGIVNFKNHIVWKRSTPRGNSSTRLPEITDFILYYTKSNSYKWNNLYTPYREEYTEKYYNQICEITGRRFQPTSLLGHVGINPVREWKGLNKPWRYSLENLDKLEDEGCIYWPNKGGMPRLKRYLDEQKGMPLQSLWEDIPPVNSQAIEDTEYPTQKPENLLQRIINLVTDEGDLVFDCFCGSGTTQAVAMKLGRRFIGADINLGAIQTTTKRLLGISAELKKQQPTLESDKPVKFTGFEVFNVNNYDFFRNPIEAKQLLIDALEIQPFSAGHIYDGEKDGRMVKIMPVNRIATKADLEELKANLPYKTFDSRKEEHPHTPVERITIVCMGHEPDLKASLERELSEYKIDIEICDILRDKSDLQLKREAEADIAIEGGRLVIRQFFPLNLMQKLSLTRDYIDDWRQLAESVMIDWNFDGVIMEPAVTDIPAKEQLVSGIYDIPKNSGTIKVKITDLLSESLEVEVQT
jgi:site-specific DNA-methyltransferase (adenine-specific)/adenine-specific DNA-methyltransferase